MEEHFRRSGYIHPVHTPTGQELTGDYPADHAHQHALFFAWTKSSYDGRKVDFWNQAKRLGRIEFREVLDLKREAQRVSRTEEEGKLALAKEQRELQRERGAVREEEKQLAIHMKWMKILCPLFRPMCLTYLEK